MRIAGVSIASVAITTAVIVTLAGLGAWLTKLGPWYRALRKPSWQPPDYAFGPAWTLIFLLCGASAVIAWNAATPAQRQGVIVAFGVNATLNSLWSYLFFARRRPDWALVEVLFFWVSIVVLIVVVRPTSSAAAWLLAPYLAWVTFASVLNQRIVSLNGPFTKP
ncbi:MAG: TspO/MBR family protein [bacterium]